MTAELFERYGLRMLEGLLVTVELVVISVALGALEVEIAVKLAECADDAT